MKNELLDFYKNHIKINPEIQSDTINSLIDCSKKFETSDSIEIKRILGLSYGYTSSFVQNYMSLLTLPEYFKNVSGTKVIVSENYTGILDFWFPTESYFFDLVRNPVIVGWIVTKLIEKNNLGCITEILDFNNPDSLIQDVLGDLRNAIMEQEFYMFFMGDLRNYRRILPIKIRRVKPRSVVIPAQHDYTDNIEISLEDQESGDIITLGKYRNTGYNIYLSKELLGNKLKDLEVLWLRGYDTRVASLDFQIESKKKELAKLEKDREQHMTGFNEYKDKIHNILWKDY